MHQEDVPALGYQGFGFITVQEPVVLDLNIGRDGLPESGEMLVAGKPGGGLSPVEKTITFDPSDR